MLNLSLIILLIPTADNFATEGLFQSEVAGGVPEVRAEAVQPAHPSLCTIFQAEVDIYFSVYHIPSEETPNSVFTIFQAEVDTLIELVASLNVEPNLYILHYILCLPYSRPS